MTATEQSPPVFFHSPFPSQTDEYTFRDNMKKDESSSTTLTQDESTPETSPETDRESIGSGGSISSGQHQQTLGRENGAASLETTSPGMLVRHPNDTRGKRPKFLDRQSFLERQISDKFCIMKLLDPSTFHDEKSGGMLRGAVPAYPTIEEGGEEAMILSSRNQANVFPSVFQKQRDDGEGGAVNALERSLNHDDMFDEVNSILSALPKRGSLPNIDYDHPEASRHAHQRKRNSLPVTKMDQARVLTVLEREDDELIEAAAAEIESSGKEKKKKSKKIKKSKEKKEKKEKKGKTHKSDSKDMLTLIDDEIDKARARISAVDHQQREMSTAFAAKKIRRHEVDMDERPHLPSHVSASALSCASPFNNSFSSGKKLGNSLDLGMADMPNLDLDARKQTQHADITRKSASRKRGELKVLDVTEKPLRDPSTKRKDRSSSSKRRDQMNDSSATHRSSRRSHRTHRPDPLVDSSSGHVDQLYDSSTMLNDTSMSSAGLHDVSTASKRRDRSSSSKKHRSSKKSSSRSKSRKREEKLAKVSNDLVTSTVATEINEKSWISPEALAKKQDVAQSALVQVKMQKVTEFGSDDWDSDIDKDDGKLEDHSISASVVSSVSRKSKKVSKSGYKPHTVDQAWDSSTTDLFLRQQKVSNDDSFQVQDLMDFAKNLPASSRVRQSNARPLVNSEPIIRSGASVDTVSTAHQSLPDTPGNRQGRPPLRPQKNGMGSHPSIASFLSATSLHIPGTPSVASATSTPRKDRQSLRAALQSNTPASSAASLASNASSCTGISRSTAGRSYADSSTAGFSKAYPESLASRSLADTTTTTLTDRSWKPSQHSAPELASLLDQGIGDRQQRRRSCDGASVESPPFDHSTSKHVRSVSTPKGGRQSERSGGSNPRKLRLGSGLLGRAKARYQGKRHQKFVSED